MKRLLIVQDKAAIRDNWVRIAREEGYWVDPISGRTAEQVTEELRALLSLQCVERSLLDYLLEDGTNCEQVLEVLTADELRRMGQIFVVSNDDPKNLTKILSRQNVSWVGPSTNWDRIRGRLQQ